MFYSIDNKRVLIVGAGDIASKKFEKLLDFEKVFHNRKIDTLNK